MKKRIMIAFFILLLGSITACNKAEEKTVANTPTETTPKALEGDTVFKQSCLSCHSSGDISGGDIVLDSTLIHHDFKAQEDLLNFVSTNMPKNRPGSLTKEKYEAIVKYLWEQK